MRLLTLILLASCFAHAQPQVRTPAEQVDSVVAIRTTCPDGKIFDGSGVIVGHHRVLTAAHVATCDDASGWYGTDAKSVEVNPGDGVFYPAKPVHVLVVRDLATLTVAHDLSLWMHRVVVAPLPKLGDRVCEAAAYPRNTYRCGDVEFTSQYEVKLSMFTEFGNSGSGAYDAEGRLVGIVINTVKCQDGFQCVGGVAVIAGLPELLE